MPNNLKNEAERRSMLQAAWAALPENLQQQCRPIAEALELTQETLKLLPSCERGHCWSYARNPGDTDDQRVRARFGRIVRRQLEVGPDAVPDEVLGQLTHRLNAHIWKETEVRRLYGKDITEAYRNSLVSSCMSGDDCDKVELYAINPDRVSLLVVVDEHEHPVARALLWLDDQGRLILDRVYGENGEAQAIASFAERLGARTRQDIFSAILPGYYGTVTVRDPVDCYPYMDTFCYASRIGEGRLRLSPVSGECELHSTEGYAGECCVECGESTWSSNDLCIACDENYVCCEHCDSRIHLENATYIESTGAHVCDDCRSEHYACCSQCDEYVPLSAIREVSGHEAMCEDCVKADPDIVRCAECDELFDRKHEVMTEDDGEFYCEQHTTVEMPGAGKEKLCA